MPRVSVDEEVSLYYQDLGEGPAVVLLHGGCMSHQVWESQVYALLDAGFRVVTPDLRGHGDSDKPASAYDAEMFATDIASLIDTLNIDSFTLLGWSLGATIALTYTGIYNDQVERLILVSSNIFEHISPTNKGSNSDLPLEKMMANQRRNRPKGMERFVAGMFAEKPDERTLQWLWTIGMQTPMRVALKSLQIYAKPDYGALQETLLNLDVPGAVFHGSNDRSATSADAKAIALELLENGTFVSFENSGHVPFIEESAKFDKQLVSFLSK